MIQRSGATRSCIRAVTDQVVAAHQWHQGAVLKGHARRQGINLSQHPACLLAHEAQAFGPGHEARQHELHPAVLFIKAQRNVAATVADADGHHDLTAADIHRFLAGLLQTPACYGAGSVQDSPP